MLINEYLEKLISIDTQFHNSTLEAVNWVKSILSSYKADLELLYNEDKKRAGLVASIGDKSQLGYVFSGHLDTVPADESFYKSSPFKLQLEGDKYYGRGVCDMKGSIACFLAQIPEIIKQGKTAHLVLTHDEEGGFKSIEQITSTAHIAQFLKQQKACIVMEPTELLPVVAHKGIRLLELNAIGKSGHSSTPSLCIDAIDAAIQSYNLIINSFKMVSQNHGADSNFIEPYSTIAVGKFIGGEAPNTISANAFFSIVSRENPNCNFAPFFKHILDSLKNSAQISLKETLFVPAFKSSCDDSFIKSINPNCQFVNYGTEAGFFEKIGLATIVCGPGSIAQAHTKNEYILSEQLSKWQSMILDIINS